MSVEAIGSLVGSLGFPIVMCIMMFKHMEKERESHTKQIERLTETINSNTTVLSELRLLMTQLLTTDDERGE